jgi:hypothetical protein
MLPNIKLIPFQENAYCWEMCLITKKGENPSNATLALRKYIIHYLEDVLLPSANGEK